MIDGVSVGAGAAGWIDARARPAGHRPIGYGAGGCRGASDRSRPHGVFVLGVGPSERDSTRIWAPRSHQQLHPLPTSLVVVVTCRQIGSQQMRPRISELSLFLPSIPPVYALHR
jgi:hypothetical protein